MKRRAAYQRTSAAFDTEAADIARATCSDNLTVEGLKKKYAALAQKLQQRQAAKLLLAGWLLAAGPLRAQPIPPRNPALTAATLDWLTARLWVKEATARPGNDGPAVAAIIQAGGGPAAQHPEWCGFTQAADQWAHKLPIPAAGMQGAAAAWFRDVARTYYLAGVRGTLALIMPGDLVGFDYGRGIHHIARTKQVAANEIKSRPPRGFYTLAGNEGRYPNAGLHLTYYPAVNIDAGARWDY